MRVSIPLPNDMQSYVRPGFARPYHPAATTFYCMSRCNPLCRPPCRRPMSPTTAGHAAHSISTDSALVPTLAVAPASAPQENLNVWSRRRPQPVRGGRQILKIAGRELRRLVPNWIQRLVLHLGLELQQVRKRPCSCFGIRTNFGYSPPPRQ